MTRTALVLMAFILAAATAITATTAFAGENRKYGYQPEQTDEDRQVCLGSGRQVGEAAARNSQNMLKLKARAPQGGNYQPVIMVPKID